MINFFGGVWIRSGKICWRWNEKATGKDSTCSWSFSAAITNRQKETIKRTVMNGSVGSSSFNVSYRCFFYFTTFFFFDLLHSASDSHINDSFHERKKEKKQTEKLSSSDLSAPFQGKQNVMSWLMSPFFYKTKNKKQTDYATEPITRLVKGSPRLMFLPLFYLLTTSLTSSN